MISFEGNAKDYCTITTRKFTTRKSENMSATCAVLKTILQKKRTCAHLMSLAQDNGTFIK